LMVMMKYKTDLDKGVLESTLNMCREEDELEAFVDAIPGYLHWGVGGRIYDIEFLLSKEKLSQLRRRLARLFASCTIDRRTMDEVTRRRRAITCCRAIWEMSIATLSNSVEGVITHLPVTIDDTLQLLAFDSDPAIAVSALKAMCIFKRAVLEHDPSRKLRTDARDNTDPDGDDDTAAARVGNIDAHPLSVHYQALQRNEKSDQRLNTVTEFTSRMLVLIPQLDRPSHRDQQEIGMTLEGLCHGLNGRDFPSDDQERLADVFNGILHAHAHAQLGSGNGESTGGHPTEPYYSMIKSTMRSLVSTLEDRFAERLQE